MGLASSSFLEMPLLLIVLGGVFVLLWLRRSKQQKHLQPLPPGPPADPIIGHLRKIPPANQATLFYEWGKIYGDVMYLEVLGQPIVVLNSAEAAVDLLDRRSANYSDRPRFVIMELMGWTRSLVFTGYGRRFQKHRRMAQQYLNMTKSFAYRPVQTQEAHIFLQSMVSGDSDHDKALRRYTTAVIMRIAYGHQITSDDDPYVDLTEAASYALSNAGSPGSTPVDFFPFLAWFPSWFPGAYYAGFARHHKKYIDRLHEIPYETVRKEMAAGEARPSFLFDLLEALSPEEAADPETLLDIRGITGLLYCAAAETMLGTLSFFVLAMVLYPQAQKRAQEEIDSVVGSERLPEFSDRKSLPFVECIVQETLRWNNVSPAGVPHRSLKDDVYRGMLIPEGSLVIANTRGMTYDEKIYKDPHAFNPSRYLPLPEGNNEPHPIGPFGFGRRVCPGRHLADTGLWTLMASTLATLDISKATGADGKEITPELECSSGITSQPAPFECCIRARNETTRDLIIHADTGDK